MSAKPKPKKRIKTIEERIERSRWCKEHACMKWHCHPHKKSRKPPKIASHPAKRSALIGRLDTLCSKYVRLRDGKCVTCGSTEELTCSHFVKRRYEKLRFDVKENLNCQCATCNDAHNKDETQYEMYVEKRYGIGTAARLRAARLDTHFSFSLEELNSIERELLRNFAENSWQPS